MAPEPSEQVGGNRYYLAVAVAVAVADDDRPDRRRRHASSSTPGQQDDVLRSDPLHGIDLLGATRRHIEFYRHHVELNALAPATIDTRLSTICGFYRLAHIDGYISTPESQHSTHVTSD